MALNNINDKKSEDFWMRTLSLITSHRKRPSSRMRVKPRRRNYKKNFKHSFYYNMFPDHHQLTGLDFLRLLHANGEINYAPVRGRKNEYRVNPHAGRGHLRSINMEVVNYYSYDKATGEYHVNPNAVSPDGHTLYQAIWKRWSNNEGGRDSKYHRSRTNHFDQLANFMIMYNNHVHGDKNYIEPNSYNQKSVDWVNHHRMHFIKSYYRKFGTYHSAFTPKGMNFSYYQNYHDKKLKPNAHDEKTKSEKKDKSRVFSDKSKYYRDKSGYGAYLYLGKKKRGIDPAVIKQQLQTGALRSYNGVKYCRHVSGSDLQQALIEGKELTNVRGKNGQNSYFMVDKKFPPHVMFPWRVSVPKYRTVKKPVNKKVFPTTGKPYTYKSSKTVKERVEGQYRQKVVGADNIFLKEDKSSEKRYFSKDGKHMTIYYRPNSQVDRNLFQRGKNVAKNSKKDYGWAITTGNSPRKDTLVFTEDPIDAESFYNSDKDRFQHKNMIFLSLSGATKGKVINNYLKANHVQKGDISTVISCLDDDRAGHFNTEQMMASETNKTKYDKDGSLTINPVTHSKQRSLFALPGTYIDRDKDRIRKILSGKLGRYHSKDCNDIVQAKQGMGKYKNVSQSKKNILNGHPVSYVNISQYSRMIVDNNLDMANQESLLGKDNARHMQNFFGSYYNLLKNLKHNYKHGFNRYNPYIKRMRSEYQRMDNVGRKRLTYFMNQEGGKFLSPHDVSSFAKGHGKPQLFKSERFSDVVHHQDLLHDYDLLFKNLNGSNGEQDKRWLNTLIHAKYRASISKNDGLSKDIGVQGSDKYRTYVHDMSNKVATYAKKRMINNTNNPMNYGKVQDFMDKIKPAYQSFSGVKWFNLDYHSKRVFELTNRPSINYDLLTKHPLEFGNSSLTKSMDKLTKNYQKGVEQDKEFNAKHPKAVAQKRKNERWVKAGKPRYAEYLKHNGKSIKDTQAYKYKNKYQRAVARNIRASKNDAVNEATYTIKNGISDTIAKSPSVASMVQSAESSQAKVNFQSVYASDMGKKSQPAVSSDGNKGGSLSSNSSNSSAVDKSNLISALSASHSNTQSNKTTLTQSELNNYRNGRDDVKDRMKNDINSNTSQNDGQSKGQAVVQDNRPDWQ